MTAAMEKHDTFLSLNFQEIARDLFLFTTWLGNIFVDPKDIDPPPEVVT